MVAEHEAWCSGDKRRIVMATTITFKKLLLLPLLAEHVLPVAHVQLVMAIRQNKEY